MPQQVSGPRRGTGEQAGAARQLAGWLSEATRLHAGRLRQGTGGRA